MTRTPTTLRFPVAAWYVAIAIGLAVVGGLSGCRKREQGSPRIPTHPVYGTLTINGAAAPGAMVKFLAEPLNGRTPTAVVREDGSFSASYYDTEDGAPAGEYKLLVVWMQTPPEGGLAQDVLGGRFLDPARPVAAITVLAGENRLPPIELTTPTEIRNKLTP